MLSDLAGKVLWVWRRRVWTRREWRTCNTVGQQTKRTTLGLTDYRLLNLKHYNIRSSGQRNELHLLIAETVEQGSEEALERGEECCSDGPEGEVGDVRLEKISLDMSSDSPLTLYGLKMIWRMLVIPNSGWSTTAAFTLVLQVCCYVLLG